MTDLSEIFARDPLSHTREDIDTIIKGMRDKRHAFNLGNTKAGTTRAAAPKAIAGVSAEDMKDLLSGGLKI